MDVNRYVYDERRGLPICTKNPQKLSKLEKQRLREREEASREEIATKTKSDANTSEKKSTSARAPNSARRSKRAAASTPRQPTSTRLQQNMLSAAKEDVVDVSSSDDDSDDDRAPAFATDEQVLNSYYAVMAENPRKDGKIPWIKITNYLKRKNLRPQTKHKMTKLVNSHAMNTPVQKTRPKRNAQTEVSDYESEDDNVDDAPAAPADSSLMMKKMYDELMAMTRTIQDNNRKQERAIQETNAMLTKKIEEGIFLIIMLTILIFEFSGCSEAYALCC